MSDFFTSLPRHETAALGSQPSDETETINRSIEAELLALPGVEGCASRPDHLVVYVADDQAAGRLPASIGGLPLRPVVTGPIRAL